MTSIIHISYELRDRNNRKTTVAVKNLINNTLSFSDPKVIDLMRVSSLKDERIRANDPQHLIINAFGLPYGLFLKRHLKRVYDFILTAAERDLITFKNVEAIHAHKLTFEGYVGFQLHQNFNIPLIITLRNTDFRVLSYRPDLLSTYKKVLKSAYKILYLVPSMIALLKNAVGKEFFYIHLQDKMVHMPNIIVRNTDVSSIASEDPYLFTVLSLSKKDVKGKNLKNLLKSIAEIQHLQVKLKIAGTGDYEWKVREWIKEFNLDEKVELLGSISNKDIDKYYASAIAFVLPSLRESFGMVYAEALFNGTPILCSKGVLGFEGFFNNVGVAADPYSVNDIKKGLIELITNNSYFRNEIAKLKKAGAFNIFNPENICDTYKQMISGIIRFDKKELSY